MVFDIADGLFELREEECYYEDGVLSILLKEAPPKRMKLRKWTTSGLERLLA